MSERLTRAHIAQRAALELPDGAYVNLGWGIPNLVSGYLADDKTIYFHTENGILGMGPRAATGDEDLDLVDAMKVPVTLIPGAAFFNQLDAHVMTRGGHLDVAIMGGLQVSRRGDLANWKVPNAKGSGGIGGAMDIAVGNHRLIITMEHTTKDGEPKVVEDCTYPITGIECVNTIITDLAVIEVADDGLLLREVAPGVEANDVQKVTGSRLSVSPDLKEMPITL
jgi:3-oxoacid CoA-transferase B subunit